MAAKSTRPASGSEHVVSHFWEIHKLEKGIWPDFHGKKVGLATLLVVRIYKELLKYKSIEPTREALDLEDVFNLGAAAVYDVGGEIQIFLLARKRVQAHHRL